MKQNGKLRAADFVKFRFGAMALTNYLGPKTLHQHAWSQQLYSRELNMCLAVDIDFVFASNVRLRRFGSPSGTATTLRTEPNVDGVINSDFVVA
jgi:hypothetical protein